MKKFNDNVWVWGHPTNSMQSWFNRGVSTVSPVEGVSYMNASCLMYNNLGDNKFDMNLESELAKDIKKVGWCIDEGATNPPNITAICKKAKEYPNIKMGMFDDFFSLTNRENNFINYTPQLMAAIREELHAAGLEMWVVLYTRDMRLVPMETIRSFLKEFDGVSLWFWDESEILNDYDKYVEIFMEETKNQKRMMGCYVYNFGEGKPATVKAVIHQLEKAKEMMIKGNVEGLFIHTNPCFGLKDEPFEAVDACQAWMREHGDDMISE